MPGRIFSTLEFDRFARKARIADAALVDAIERTERGLLNSDLGGGLFKLRIARRNEGRRDGYRTIVALIVGRRAFFLFGYAKNDMDNIGPRVEEQFRAYGAELQNVPDAILAALMADGVLREIER